MKAEWHMALFHKSTEPYRSISFPSDCSGQIYL